MAEVEKFVLYHYYPKFAAAVVFIILFGLSALCHGYQLLRRRTWYFIPFLIGCLCKFSVGPESFAISLLTMSVEAVGYVGRAISAKQSPDWTTMPYVIQSLLLLLGPTLLAASIYMVLGRLIRLLEADDHSIIKPRWLTKFFVFGDVASFLAQSAGMKVPVKKISNQKLTLALGGGMLAQAKTQHAFNLGQYVIIAGLGIQIAFFGFFMIVTCIFHYRIVNKPTSRSHSISVPWQSYILVLYAASVMIMIRSVFRIAEYITGANGVLQSTELYIYIFDATLMFIVVALFIVFHPSKIISKESSRDSQTELGLIPGGTQDSRYTPLHVSYPYSK
jgi:hypothetical protein